MQNTHVRQHVLPIKCWVPSLSFSRFVDSQGGEIYLQLYCLIMLERLSLLKRMVRHLIAIEVEADNQVPGHSCIPLQGSQPVVNSNPPTGRPRCNEAVRGEILRRNTFEILTLRLFEVRGVKSGECENLLIDTFDMFLNILLFLLWCDKYIPRD